MSRETDEKNENGEPCMKKQRICRCGDSEETGNIHITGFIINHTYAEISGKVAAILAKEAAKTDGLKNQC